jgi:hypothetical protein
LSRKKSSTKSKHSKADLQAAVQNLIARGLVVAREVNGKRTYFATEHAPPPDPLELDADRNKPGKNSYLGHPSIIRRVPS